MKAALIGFFLSGLLGGLLYSATTTRVVLPAENDTPVCAAYEHGLSCLPAAS